MVALTVDMIVYFLFHDGSLSIVQCQANMCFLDWEYLYFRRVWSNMNPMHSLSMFQLALNWNAITVHYLEPLVLDAVYYTVKLVIFRYCINSINTCISLINDHLPSIQASTVILKNSD